MAFFSQRVTAEKIGSDYISTDSFTDLFAIDSSNQLGQPHLQRQKNAAGTRRIKFFFFCLSQSFESNCYSLINSVTGLCKNKYIK